MGLFGKSKTVEPIEERSPQEYSYGNLSITSFFSAGKVTEEQALKIPAVVSALELISSSIAQLPIYLYKEQENGEVVKVPDNRVYLLNDEPNELANGYTFKKQVVKDYLFYGSSYIKVDKVLNNVTGLYLLPINSISVTKYKKDGYKYSATINLMHEDSSKFEFLPEELVIILKNSKDGVTSEGVLQLNSDTLRLAIDEQDYTQGILKNGALPIGVLKAASRLTDKALDRLRSAWENLYAGPKKAGKTIILEEGLDYLPISMKPNELDLTNVRKHTVSEIARIFNVPESMINSAANKYASNEQNNIHFLQYCISPIIGSIESALNKSLLLESEKEQGYYFRFDVSELLRTTEREKIDTVVLGMKNGLISINEARAKIDYPAIDVDYFTWGLGSVFYNPKTGEMTIPNMGVTIDPDNPQYPDQSTGQAPADSEKGESDEDEKDTDEDKKDEENKDDDKE